MTDGPLNPPSAAELKQIFAERGIRPSRVRGQNFLVDANLMRFIVEAANLGPDDIVLEPGPGTGGLTGLMAPRVARVISVEIDRGLYEIASERLAGFSNVHVIHADIMGKGEEISATARKAVESALKITGGKFKVVANLPYIVSTAFIGAILAGELRPAEMLVMVQREVAERLGAGPGEEAYGYLSVIVQAVARVESVRSAPPGAFWPRPEVDSKIVRIVPTSELSRDELTALRRTAGGLFKHRRKQLSRSLVMSGLAADREEAARLLEQIGVAGSARCEELSVGQFRRLSVLIHRRDTERAENGVEGTEDGKC